MFRLLFDPPPLFDPCKVLFPLCDRFKRAMIVCDAVTDLEVRYAICLVNSMMVSVNATTDALYDLASVARLDK